LLALFKRGQDFDKKGRIKYSDKNVEIVLVGGKRLDTYIPPIGNTKRKIISRKATDIDKLSETTWHKYCDELVTKYKVGSELNQVSFHLEQNWKENII
jgi:hypothetical protein